jgi:protein-S-isoprenylcysteine O-methyltransferase Ste14
MMEGTAGERSRRARAAARRSWLAPGAALVLAGLVLVLVLTAAVVPLSMLVGHDVVTQSLQSYGVVVPVAAVALIIAWRRPGNPIGRLLLRGPAVQPGPV